MQKDFTIDYGYKFVEFYEIDYSVFLFVHKDNDTRIYQVDNSGKILYENIKQEPEISYDWKIARFYKIKGQMFLLLLKKNTATIYKINYGGNIQDPSQPFKKDLYFRNWDIAELFEINGVPYLFHYIKRSENGTIRICKIIHANKICMGNITNGLIKGSDDFPSPESNFNLISPY